MAETVYLGVGSNLGDRERYLTEALLRLEEAELHVQRRSPIYETKPMYVEAQPAFLNMVAEVNTTLSPRALLGRLQQVEQELGRRRTERNGPRTIDLDILFYGQAMIDEPGLCVPHPHLTERRFVLEPLAALAPDWSHPVLHQTVTGLLAALPGPPLPEYRAAAASFSDQ